MKCYCGSGSLFSQCCEPLLQGLQKANNPEVLMRSRFSAFSTNNFQYLLSTTGKDQRNGLTEEDFAESNLGTTWLMLELVSTITHANQVEFKAYYQHDKKFLLHHELSNFEQQNDKWCYTTGEIFDDSGVINLGRNDICLCGSQKKYKKCCGR